MVGSGEEDASSVRSARQMADMIAARIHGGDLPAGTLIDPALIASVHGTGVGLVEDALALLESGSEVRRSNGRWRVSNARPRGPREIMIRAQPALVAVARLAATRATARQISEIGIAREKLVGLVGDGGPQSRADGYREMMLWLGEASGSDFLLHAIRRLLREGAAMVDALARMDMLVNPVPRADGELIRLVAAIRAGDAEAAAAAMEDHVIIISHQLDAMSRD